jgi:hypothetical protein
MLLAKSRLLALSGTAALVMILAPAARARGRGHHGTGGQASLPCGDGMIVYSPTTLFPPNHQMETVSVQFIDSSSPGATTGDKDGDAVSLSVNSITDNESTADDSGGEGCGAPTSRQGSDWVFSDVAVTGTDPSVLSTTVQVRAERCGGVAGPRIYDINVSCGDGDAGTSPTTVDLLVAVPHDRHD